MPRPADRRLHPLPRATRALRAGVLLAASLFTANAQAVFFTFDQGPREITMRVGPPNTGVAEVAFNVAGSNLSPAPTEVAASTGAVEVEATWQRPGFSGLLSSSTITVDSSAGLVCQAGSGCGSTVIPFTEVCWTTSDPAPGGGDMVSGCFTGAASQQVGSIGVVVLASQGMRNTLSFRFKNSRVYPAGIYKGRVTFTATLL